MHESTISISEVIWHALPVERSLKNLHCSPANFKGSANTSLNVGLDMVNYAATAMC